MVWIAWTFVYIFGTALTHLSQVNNRDEDAVQLDDGNDANDNDDDDDDGDDDAEEEEEEEEEEVVWGY